MAGARRSRGEKRDHLFPMLEVKETSAMTHAQKVPAGVRDASPQPIPPTSQRPVSAKRCCVHTGEGPESGQGWAQAQTKQDHGPEEAGRTAPCKGWKPPPKHRELSFCLSVSPGSSPARLCVSLNKHSICLTSLSLFANFFLQRDKDWGPLSSLLALGGLVVGVQPSKPRAT